MRARLLIATLTIGMLSFAPLTFAQEMGGNDDAMKHSEMSKTSTMDMGMIKDLGPADKNYDLRFLNAMLVHHEGAITMAKDALQKSKRPEVQKLAKEIIEAQQKEIAQMKTWRKAWYQK